MQRRGFAKTIGLLFVIIAVIGVFGYIAMQPRVGWPDEARRVVHPVGFSVVQPQDWEQHLSYGSSGQTGGVLKFMPKETVGSPGFLSTTQLANVPTEADLKSRGYTPTTYANAPAWERITQHPLTHEYSRSLVFIRDGRAFDMTLRRPTAEPYGSGVWKAYLDSFRLEAVKTPTSAPVIVPLDLAPTTAPAAK